MELRDVCGWTHGGDPKPPLFRIRRALFVVLSLILLSGVMVACDSAGATPRLYRLDQDGTTLYLMGTVHAFPPGVSVESMLISHSYDC